MNIVPHPIRTNVFLCDHKNRNFVVKKSKFGWHISETTGGKNVQQPFALLYKNKKECLGAIESNV